ncbi:hypothetical protein DW833_11825 [Anaerobutyricum hallii]|uniref:Uncharacterized protein n=1 Tax=Anaerobutyricum hallii TaxID=39488 RepID=A0A414B3N1_9FIRM|nr:hypothetical protein DW833_11825 [Anaerobutyricum hallii]
MICGKNARACLKNHSYNLHAPICGIFCLHSVGVARYAALIQAKSPTNCNAHLAESIFQTRSKESKKVIRRMAKSQKFSKDSYNIK